MEEIRLAPEQDEIKFTEKRNTIYCTFNGIDIEYSLPFGMAFNKEDEKYHKKAFQTAIAMSSKDYELERKMNALYRVRGEVVMRQHNEIED